MSATAAYDAIEAMNWSTLRHLETSPLLLDHRKRNPRPDTDSLRLGRAIHCALLEPDRWKRFLVEPKFDKRTKDGLAARAKWLVDELGEGFVPLPAFKLNTKAKFLEEVPDGATVIAGDEATAKVLEGRELIDEETRALADRCAKAVLDHPKAAAMLAFGKTEEPITWTDRETGVPCKARLDLGKPGFVLDVKSSRQPTLRGICADFARYRYHGQLAFYQDGAITSRRIPADAPPPRVIVVQTVEPFDVVPGWIGQWDLDRGRALYKSLLRRYLECTAAEWWPGIAPEPIELPLPDWTPGAVDEVREDW
jgi:hypothetical protein